MRRRSAALLLVFSVVAAALAGALASATIRSPAEQAARTRPPAASTILVPVEKRVLSTKVVTRGTARYGIPQAVSLTPSALKTVSGVVSQIGAPGAQLKEGAVALLQSGRPVFVLQGRVPSYRDLGPGLEGEDVRQLQQALSRRGFDPGPVNGVYGARTEAAVARWYRAAGFDPFEATTDQLAEIRARESEFLTARIDVLASSDGLALAASDAAAARAAQQAAVAAASRAFNQVAANRAMAAALNRASTKEVEARSLTLKTLRSGTPGTAAETAQAQADLATASAESRDIHLSGLAAIADAGTEVSRQVAAVKDAKAALAEAIDVGLAEVQAAQAQLVEAEADPASTEAVIAAARAALTRARAEAAAAERAARVQLEEATAAEAAARIAQASAQTRARDADTAAASREAAATAALQALTSGTRASATEIAAAVADLAAARTAAVTAANDGARLVAEARSAAAAARSAVAPANAAVSAALTAQRNARGALALRRGLAGVAERGLDTATRRAGVQVPSDEIVVVPEIPIRVSEVLVAPGDPASGQLMTVTNQTVSVDGALALDEARLVHPGMRVQLDEPDLGIAATGVVSVLAATPGTLGADGFHVHFEVVVDGNPPGMPGASVRITIPVKSSGTKALVVPVGALTLAPDGSSRVAVERNGRLEPLTVVPGLVADGYVEVTPEGGSLAPGDQVAVGDA